MKINFYPPKMSYKKKIIVTVLVIFFMALMIRSLPVIYKGFSFMPASTRLLAAKNLAETGKFAIESEKNVILSSSRIADEGVEPGTTFHRFTSIIYSWVFKVFGFSQELPFYISMFLYAITNVLLFFLILKMFNYQLAVLFSVVDIFCPIVNARALCFGSYEFAMLFFVLALFIYLYKEKPGIFRLFLASVFFGLGAITRSPFVFSFIPFIAYDFFKNKSFKRIIIFIIPFVLIFGQSFDYDYYFGREPATVPAGAVNFDAHLFRDPYTYHFAKDEYMAEVATSETSGDTLAYLKRYGYKLNTWQFLSIYLDSIKYYAKHFVSLVTYGGFLMIFLMGLGLYYLFRKRKDLALFFIFWFVVFFGGLVFFKTSNINHFIEIRFLTGLLAAIGVYFILGIIRKQEGLSARRKKMLVGLIVLLLILHLAQANKWAFHDFYSNSGSEQLISFVDVLKDQEEKISEDDIVAVDFSPAASTVFNYYTNRSYIYFTSESIEESIKEKKLQEVFDYFGVTKVAGYSPELTEEILKNSEAQNIASFEAE